MFKTVRGRYAPSPTGFLHLGNARTALLAWLQARSLGADFVMRVEDLDSRRCKGEFIEANLAELKWLGLEWDEGPNVGGPFKPYVQSERHDLYQKALHTLVEKGFLFECYLSRKDLREVSSAPHGHMLPYGETERRLNDDLKAQKIREGKTPSLRFRADAQTKSFQDNFLGKQRFEVGDFIVKRADGEWAYQLAVVVDDIGMQISHVLRGDDLLSSTATQLLLYEALDAALPSFSHVPLLLDASGERMAKRKGSLTLSALMEKRVSNKRVIGLLSYSLGLSQELQELSVNEALERFDLSLVPKTAFTLKKEHLEWLVSSRKEPI